MTFKQSVKQIKPTYFTNLKILFNSSLIFKTIYQKDSARLLHESNVYFSILNFNKFDDKNILKQYAKNPAKAIENLRVRGACCVYLVDIVEELEINYTHLTTVQLQALDILKEMSSQLKILAKTSFNQANKYAVQHDLPNNIDIDYPEPNPEDEKHIEKFK